MTGLALTVAGGTTQVADAMTRLTGLLEAGGAGPRMIARVELLFEEVVLNALRHGAAPEVLVTADLDGGALTLVFEDAGPPFDPVAAPLPDPGRSLATATIGGRGLLLIRRMARDLSYERLPQGVNRLTVTLAPR